MTAALPDPNAVTQAVAGTRWRTVEVVAETGSTNADLAERAAAGETIDGAVLVAGRQTAGRGRHARQWSSPAGSLSVSTGLRVADGHAEALGWLSLLTGMAVADAVAEVVGVTATVKWPNDVLGPDGRKLAGILAEMTGPGTVIIGTGLNVDIAEADLPVPTAGSIAALSEEPVDPTALLAGYLRALSEHLSRWPDDLAGLAQEYRRRSATLGSQVRLILPGDTEVVGEAVDVDEAGRLLVDTDTGRVVAAAGDVTHLRRA